MVRLPSPESEISADMNTKPSPLYSQPIADLSERLVQTIEAGCAEAGSKVQVFFRADDIGAPGKSFTKMAELFRRYEIPLCLAIVPAWLNITRYAALRKATNDSNLFCWHQHGWLHKNHQPSGKKGEFGDSRHREQLRNDLSKGKNRLADILEDAFFPVFTPPWNRCGQTTLELLRELGFAAISRSTGASPASLPGLPDFQVNVDLHTRKERIAEESLGILLGELRQSLAGGQVGIMLHHQRINDNGFHLLECVLQLLKSSKGIDFVDFRRLIPR